MATSLTLLFHREPHVISLPAPLHQTTLAQLLTIAGATLGVPQQRLRLIYSGFAMKDLAATLDQYGVHENSKILVLSSPGNGAGASSSPDPSIAPAPVRPNGASSPVPPPQSTSSAAETAIIDHVSSLVSAALTPLNPMLYRFTQLASDPSMRVIPVKPGQSPDEITKLKLSIGEGLMQALLKVDSVTVAPGQDMARQKRKESVNTLQGIMDEVDAKYREVKARL
ncbi:hypothetical protein BC828DRAFT_382429 [Blastocladiella britannica]|nr:hypothetical protein BC828DRAFT_382429 [Blastocladiella britannica]